MRKKLQLIELIERYLSEDLSKEELAAFETKLQSDESLRKEVESQKLLLSGIERIGVKQDIQIAKRKYFKQHGGWYFGAAFIIILSCIIYFYFPNKEKGQKVQETITQNSAADLDSSSATTSASLNQPIVEIESNKEDSKALVKSIATKKLNTSIPIKPEEKFKLPEKEYQYFKIAQNRDTTLKGASGTIIGIKANSFTTEFNQVTIRLKEFYKLSDMVFSDLSTATTSDEIIETGGMIYLDAISKSGERVELKKNKNISLKFPFKEEKPDMQLFNGLEEEGGDVLWKVQEESSSLDQQKTLSVNPSTTEPLFNHVFTIVEEMPRHPTCKQVNEKEMEKCTEAAISNFIKENFKFPNQYLDKKVSEKILIQYTINERGFVTNTKLVRGDNPLLNKEALRVVSSLPRLIPGKQRGRNVPVQVTIPLKINADDFSKGYSLREIKAFGDSVEKVREKERELVLKDVLSDDQQGSTDETRIDDIAYYVFATSNLGWINCDRFIRDSRDKINFALSDFPRESNVRIIFHSTKSLIGGTWKNGAYNFYKLPKGEKISIFAIKEIDGTSFICLQETEISADEPVLEFKKASVEDIKAFAKKINSIHE